ncbi:tetratricopeptide repeat protein [Microseira sp. BLCC-F43]|uniref:tetratricopeptide repeat protein n=1 Tax=Microseira sp. BLCC-F43 TaxID=3153602 RepID=UPI0035BA70F7
MKNSQISASLAAVILLLNPLVMAARQLTPELLAQTTYLAQANRVNYSKASVNQCAAYLRLGEYKRAIDECTKVLALEPNQPLAYVNRGTAYFYQGDYTQAIRDYTKAIELAPDPTFAAVVYSSRGNARRFLQDYQGAIEDCTRAIELDPNYAEAYDNRGLVRQQMGEYQLALEDYHQALVVARKTAKPELEAIIFSNIARAYQSLGQTQKAQLYLTSAFLRAIDDFWQQMSIMDALEALVPPTQVSNSKASQWVTYYYLQPDASQLTAMVRQLEREGVFDKPSAFPPLAAFIGEVFRQNPAQVRRWLAELTFDNQAHQRIIWEAAWLSQTNQAQAELSRLAQVGDPTISETLPRGVPPNLLTVAISSPSILDMLWATFMASGDERYVQRIIAVLTWKPEAASNPREALRQALIVKAARWSLQSNMSQHKRVYQICQDLANNGEPALRQPVRALLEQVTPPQ